MGRGKNLEPVGQETEVETTQLQVSISRSLLYGRENWTIKARDAIRIKAAEMKYMRRRAGYTWADHKTNT
jgi:hypothetical protein